jgi:hypothetical protein
MLDQNGDAVVAEDKQTHVVYVLFFLCLIWRFFADLFEIALFQKNDTYSMKFPFIALASPEPFFIRFNRS